MMEPNRGDLAVPKIVDRATFQADMDALRIREKAHTREGDAIAAARRRLPMVKVESATPLIGATIGVQVEIRTGLELKRDQESIIANRFSRPDVVST